MLDAATGKDVPGQYDILPQQTLGNGEGILAGCSMPFCVGNLAPHTGKTFLAYWKDSHTLGAVPAVTYRETDKGFEIDNGALTLSKSNPDSGAIFDRISLGGVELGRFTPLLWQEVGQSLWIPPERIEKVEVSNGPVRLVLDVTAVRSGAGGEKITRVDETGKQAAMAARPMCFRTKYRIIIEPGKPWFSSQLLSIENTDTQPWQLAGYYHYLQSNIAGQMADDEARGTYWHNAAAGLNFGIVPTPPITVSFWKDAAGGEHPDALRKVGVTLKPGDIYKGTGSEPQVFIVAAKDTAWQSTLQQLADKEQVEWKMGEVEMKGK